MTYSEIQKLFYEIIGDSENNPAWITSDMAKQFANAALQMAVSVSRYLESRNVILLTAGVQDYNIPETANSIFRVTYGGEVILPISQSQLRVIDDEWIGKTGTPRLYYSDEMNRRIGLYKAPALSTTYKQFGGEFGAIVSTDNASDVFSQEFGIIVDVSDASTPFVNEFGEIASEVTSNELEVFYKAIPNIIVDGTSVPDIPSWSYPYILFAMLSKSYAADTDLQDGTLSEFWERLGLMMLVRLRGRSASKLNKTWVSKTKNWSRSGTMKNIRYPDNIPEAT